MFCDPKLLITNYYDSLVNCVHSYTEELLGKYRDDALLPVEPKPHRVCGFQQLKPFRVDKIYEANNEDGPEREPQITKHRLNEIDLFDDSSLFLDRLIHEFNSQFVPGSIKVKDYLNLVRFKAIEAIKKTQNINMENLESNKSRLKLENEDIENLNSMVFANKFCFLLEINHFQNLENKCIYKLGTFVVDFYLSPRHLMFLK